MSATDLLLAASSRSSRGPRREDPRSSVEQRVVSEAATVTSDRGGAVGSKMSFTQTANAATRDSYEVSAFARCLRAECRALGQVVRLFAQLTSDNSGPAGPRLLVDGSGADCIGRNGVGRDVVRSAVGTGCVGDGPGTEYNAGHAEDLGAAIIVVDGVADVIGAVAAAADLVVGVGASDIGPIVIGADVIGVGGFADGIGAVATDAAVRGVAEGIQTVATDLDVIRAEAFGVGVGVIFFF